MPLPALTPAPTAALPSIPLLHSSPSFSQLLVRRRSSRRQLSHTPSTKTSSSSASAGTIFRRALQAVEEVGREKRVAEWRKREVGERAVESWREEVADEVALELEREREEEGREVVLELTRLMEGSEVFSSRFSPGALHLPSSPSGTPSSSEVNVSSHELEDQLSPLPLPIRTTSLGVDSAMTPARLRLSQQRFNASAPISPPYPSLYYQFPPHDPSGTLTGGSQSRPSSPRLRRPRPPRDDPPPPLGSLPPKAAALLGLLTPLQLPSGSMPPTPTPSSFTALLPSSPLLRRTAYSPSPSPSTAPSNIDYHLPPRPSFTLTDRRGSADSAALSLAAPSTRSATASTVKSFWSACVPGGAGGGGHSPSNSFSPSSAATSAGPILPPSTLEIKIPSSPSSPKNHRSALSSSSPTLKSNTFGARRRHALEQRHGLGSTSLPDLSLEALGAFSPSPSSPSREPLEVNLKPPLYGSNSASPVYTASKAGGRGKGLGLAAVLGRKLSARRGKGRGRGRAQTALPAPTSDSRGRGMSVDRSRGRVVVATTAEVGTLWRAPSDEEVVEDDGEVRVRFSSSKEGRRKTREAWEMESEVLRMRIRENLGY